MIGGGKNLENLINGGSKQTGGNGKTISKHKI